MTKKDFRLIKNPESELCRVRINQPETIIYVREMVLNENKILIYGSCTCIVEIKGSLIISKEILLQNLIQPWARGGVHTGPLPKKASFLPEPLEKKYIKGLGSRYFRTI